MEILSFKNFKEKRIDWTVFVFVSAQTDSYF